MRKYLLLLVCLLSLGFTFTSFAQGAPQLQWVFNAVSTPPSNYQNSEGNRVVTDAFGNVYVAGNFTGSADFDPSAGTAKLTSVSNSKDFFLAKYDSHGNYLWAKAMGGASAKNVSALLIDKTGKVVIAGSFRGTVDFDPSTAVANFTTVAPGANLFIAKYDSNGNYLWAKAMGAASDVGVSLALNSSGEIYVAGEFAITADFDPSPNIANLDPGGDSIYIAKYDANGNYL